MLLSRLQILYPAPCLTGAATVFPLILLDDTFTVDGDRTFFSCSLLLSYCTLLWLTTV